MNTVPFLMLLFASCAGYLGKMIPQGNWAKATEKFAKHEASKNHGDAHAAWLKRQEIQRGEDTSIVNKVVPDTLTIAEENMKYFIHLFEYIKWFVTCELPIRGHDETDESPYRGNWLSFIKMQLNTNPSFKEFHCKMKRHRTNTDYTSKTTVNEIINSMADHCREKIYSEVQQAGCFSALSDESKDKGKRKEFALTIRYCSEGDVHERFLCLEQLKKFELRLLPQ